MKLEYGKANELGQGTYFVRMTTEQSIHIDYFLLTIDLQSKSFLISWLDQS